MKLYRLLALLVLLPVLALAQSTQNPPPAGSIVAQCVYNTTPPAPTPNQPYYLQCDAAGHLITASSSVATTEFNIASYGAVCNVGQGPTPNDDTAAVQAAVNAWKLAGATSTSGAAVLVGMGQGNKCLITSPLDFTRSNQSASIASIVRDLYLYGSFSGNTTSPGTGSAAPMALPIGALLITAAGTGGTPGTYTNVALTGGSGTGCSVNVTIGSSPASIGTIIPPLAPTTAVPAVTNGVIEVQTYQPVAWAAGTTYAIGQVVIGSDNKVYTSLQAANIGNAPPSSPTFWQTNGVTIATGGTVGGCGTGYKYTDTFTVTAGGITASLIPLSLSGGAVIDATASRYIRFQNVVVEGDCRTIPNVPNVGFAIGRAGVTIGSGVPWQADSFYFDGAMTYGCFQFAGMYNLASEMTTFVHAKFTNLAQVPSPGGVNIANCFVYVGDGTNHFNWATPFNVPWNATVDTDYSFTENSWLNSSIVTPAATGCISSVWLGGARHHRFYDTYVDSQTTSVILWMQDSASTPEDIQFDSRFENGANMAYCFVLAGNIPGYSIPQFLYADNTTQCNTNVFKADTAGQLGVPITSVTANNFSFRGTRYALSPSFLDVPSLYTITANFISLPNATSWGTTNLNTGMVTYPNLAGGGTVCLASVCTPVIPTLSLNRNDDMLIDQPLEGNSVTVGAGTKTRLLDGWVATGSGGLPTGRYTVQRTTTGSPGGYFYNTSVAVSTTATPGATEWHALESIIEGNDFQQLKWGTSNAVPISLNFWAKTSLTSTAAAPTTWNVAIGNSAQTRNYVAAFQITATNTFQNFCIVIPGDTGTGWANTIGQIGIRIVFPVDVGSGSVTPPNVWTASAGGANPPLIGSSAAAPIPAGINLISQPNGTTFAFAAVHLQPNGLCLPHQVLPIAQTMSVAQRWYSKSFNEGTAPAQNLASGNGAATFTAPLVGANGIYVVFPRSMYRNNLNANPTITYYDTNAADTNCWDVTASATAGASSTVNVGSTGFMLQCASNPTAGHTNQVQWTADTGF